MNKLKLALPILFIAILSIFSGCATANQQETETTATLEEGENPSETEVTDAAEMVHEIMEDEETISYLNDTPEYLDYSEDKYNELLGEKPFVLFFHADWCPTCRQLEDSITADISTFPKGTKILKTDFDTETELKKQYKITSQSTFAIIDASAKHLQTLAAPNNDKLINAINNSL